MLAEEIVSHPSSVAQRRKMGALGILGAGGTCRHGLTKGLIKNYVFESRISFLVI